MSNLHRIGAVIAAVCAPRISSQSAGAGPVAGLGREPDVKAPMSDLSLATASNIKRFKNLLDTSVDATEQQLLQRLLAEEEAKAVLQASGQKK